MKTQLENSRDTNSYRQFTTSCNKWG